MKTQFFILMAALLLLGGGFVACDEPSPTRAEEPQEEPKEEEPQENETKTATGTVIGNYANGVFYVLIQVDKEYPIGRTIEYTPDEERPEIWEVITLPDPGTYGNMIGTQAYKPMSEVRGKRISFSYREFREEEDNELFIIGIGLTNTLGVFTLDIPIYVMTDCQILD